MAHTRRRFLHDLSLAGATLAYASTATPFQRLAAQDKGSSPAAAELIPGKDPRLIVHKPSPAEIETPAALLVEHRVTPVNVLFVRNNQQPEGPVTLEPAADADNWPIELSGLVEAPRSIRLSELKKLPQVEHEVVLQCSGNGRKLFSQAAPCAGAQWEVGAVANVKFRGVPLREMLKHLQANLDPRARFVTAEGKDAPHKPDGYDFEHSVPLQDAVETGFVAWELNGQPMPVVHGGPARLIMPGYYGTMHVKWLSRLRFESLETANHHQVKRYRTPKRPIEPGSEFEYGLANSDPNWRMKIKSIILAPTEGAEVPAGRVEVRGVAFNDGRAKIDRVDISTDGDTWQRADLQRNEDPYGWSIWTARVELPRGERTVMCRAIDAWGRTQPLDGQIHWNPAGYAWNGVHHVRVRAS